VRYVDPVSEVWPPNAQCCRDTRNHAAQGRIQRGGCPPTKLIMRWITYILAKTLALT
jgi:hypothetical protein